MFYPELREPEKRKMNTQEWRGYNHNLRCAEGEFWDMGNMTGDNYPVLSPRKARRLAFTGSGPVRGMTVWDGHLICVVGTKLYVDGTEIDNFELPSGEKSPERPCTIVSMGAYLVFFPDKKYFKISEYFSFPFSAVWVYGGSLEASITLEATDANPITYEMCQRDGTVYQGVQTTAPLSPSEGALWLDGSTLKTWSSGVWSEIPQVYVKISKTGIDSGFSQYDGVSLKYSGAPFGEKDSVPESAVLEQVKSNYIVVPGIVTAKRTQTSGTVTVARKVPDMDYVVECGNRLWGCKGGYEDTDYTAPIRKFINEIYACALGDFKNWNQFRGLSTDSYVASRGSEGVWTGAITYQGRPTFFKAGSMDTVYPSESGAHQIVSNNCRGCLPGTLAVVDEVLYYCTGRDVVAFDGSYPKTVSRALGALSETTACAGSLGHKYYLYLQSRGLMVLDTATMLWHREDMAGAKAFAWDYSSLYFAKGAEVWQPEGGGEEEITWYAETGDIGLGEPGTKYISRLVLRFWLEIGAWVDVFVSYDSTGIWEHKGHLQGGCFIRSVPLPIIPKRCDHMRIKIAGKGTVKIYSLAKQYEEGSDVF